MRYIEAAGRLGSIAKAAQELGISQSSISAAIDSLEQRMNYDLFVRTPAKGIRATPAGTAAIHTIREFLEQSKHFETELKSIGGQEGGTLRIACFVTAAGSFLPPILQEFKLAHPNVRIEFLEDNMEGVVDLLEDGRADVAFTYSDVVSPNHVFDPLVSVPPFALVAQDSNLAKQDDVSLAELATLPMVLLDLKLTKGYYLRLVTDAGHDVRVSHRTESVEMVRTLVSNGFGFSILNAKPSEYIEGHSSYRPVPIREMMPHREFGILRQSGMRHPKIVRNFVELCSQLKNKGAFEEMIVEKPSKRLP
jgi:DNA-binding transcriptional LysR family regulator